LIIRKIKRKKEKEKEKESFKLKRKGWKFELKKSKLFCRNCPK
jgi:hypothetical protein